MDFIRFFNAEGELQRASENTDENKWLEGQESRLTSLLLLSLTQHVLYIQELISNGQVSFVSLYLNINVPAISVGNKSILSFNPVLSTTTFSPSVGYNKGTPVTKHHQKHHRKVVKNTSDDSWSPTTAVSFSVPDTVTALASSGTDMLFPHIHCTRCWEIGNNRCQLNKKKRIWKWI